MDVNSETWLHIATLLLGPGGGVLGFVAAARGKFSEVLSALEGIQKTLGEMKTTDALLAQRVTSAEAEILELRRRTHDLYNMLGARRLAEDVAERRTASSESVAAVKPP